MARSAQTPIDGHGSVQPKRRSGRPKNDGGRVGVEELVRRCVDLLDSTPPEKLTFSALARHAAVTPALINYYFKDRSELVVAVVRHLIAETRLTAVQDEPATARDDLRTYIQRLIEAHEKHPYFHRILLEELMEDPTPVGRTLFEEATDSGLGAFGDILRRGEAEGVMRRADPLNLYVAIIGMCAFSVTGRPIFRHASPDIPVEELTASYTDEVFHMVMGWLAPIPDPQL